MSTARPTFVLVHGAWHGGWCWRHVARRLRDAGYEVHAPTLTGLGERAHLATPEVSLETHIQDVLGVIDTEELDRVVLCGHSYGGLVVTGAADRRSARIAGLVFLDAFIPEHGQSLLAIHGPESEARIRAAAAERGQGWLMPPFDAARFCVQDAADAAWVDRRVVPQPIANFAQPIALTGAWRSIPTLTYIRALGYPNSPFARYSEQVRDDARWHYHEVPCGHDVMVDMPVELSEHLLAVAASGG
jgi:pimeloyl-ACP methyl ester carboxylesterase